MHYTKPRRKRAEGTRLVAPEAPRHGAPRGDLRHRRHRSAARRRLFLPRSGDRANTLVEQRFRSTSPVRDQQRRRRLGQSRTSSRTTPIGPSRNPRDVNQIGDTARHRHALTRPTSSSCRAGAPNRNASTQSPRTSMMVQIAFHTVSHAGAIVSSGTVCKVSGGGAVIASTKTCQLGEATLQQLPDDRQPPRRRRQHAQLVLNRAPRRTRIRRGRTTEGRVRAATAGVSRHAGRDRREDLHRVRQRTWEPLKGKDDINSRRLEGQPPPLLKTDGRTSATSEHTGCPEGNWGQATIQPDYEPVQTASLLPVVHVDGDDGHGGAGRACDGEWRPAPNGGFEFNG